MKILKAYKYRMYPNVEQKVFFTKTFGCARFIYNRMLADRIEYYKITGKSLKNNYAQYKSEFPFLKEIDSLALANAYLNLNYAYSKFFKNKSTGFPKFKKKSSNDFSYKTNNQDGTIAIIDGKLKLPKLKSLVKIKLHREFSGKIKSATISKNPSDQYFVSILVEVEVETICESLTKKSDFFKSGYFTRSCLF